MVAEKLSAFELHADPTVLWRPIVLYLALGTTMSGLVIWASRDVAGSTEDAIADFCLLAVLLGAVLIAMTCPLWLWTAGRTSYSVGAGRLHVAVGRKKIDSWELSGMRAVRLEGATSWGNLLTPFNVDGGVFPRITFINDEGRVVSSPILLWGCGRTHAAERALRAAISSDR